MIYFFNNIYNNILLIDDHWMLLKQLSIDQIKSLTRRLKDQRLIVSQHSQLTDWLASKEKMMVVLSAAMIIEPSILQNQIDQVQVIVYFKYCNQFQHYI